MKIKTYILGLTLALTVLGIVGCESPLAVDAPRKITPITPAPKVTPRTITANFETANGEYTFFGQPKISIDTTLSPMRFWVDFQMSAMPNVKKPLIDSFKIAVDSMPGDAYNVNLVGFQAEMAYNWGQGVEWFYCDLYSNTATAMIKEEATTPGQPREVTITIYLIANKNQTFPVPQEQLLGTIHLVI